MQHLSERHEFYGLPWKRFKSVVQAQALWDCLKLHACFLQILKPYTVIHVHLTLCYTSYYLFLCVFLTNSFPVQTVDEPLREIILYTSEVE